MGQESTLSPDAKKPHLFREDMYVILFRICVPLFFSYHNFVIKTGDLHLFYKNDRFV